MLDRPCRVRQHGGMDTVPLTNLARWLAAPDRVERLADLAQGWRDQEVVVTLAPVASADDGFGAHLRRSFLAALAPGASAPARAGRACPWDPPCALDIFLREQLRVGGDGLPKPYVLCWQQTGPQIAVTLRLFGTACDWAPAAAEALVAGLTGILPWPRALPGQHSPPAILDRQMPQLPLPDLPDAPLTLCLITPMDDEGAKTDRDLAARLL